MENWREKERRGGKRWSANRRKWKERDIRRQIKKGTKEGMRIKKNTKPEWRNI
jgi:hypothetical protein